MSALEALATFVSPHELIDATGLHPLTDNLGAATREHAARWTAARVLADAKAGALDPRAGGTRRAHAYDGRVSITLGQHDEARRLYLLLDGATR